MRNNAASFPVFPGQKTQLPEAVTNKKFVSKNRLWDSLRRFKVAPKFVHLLRLKAFDLVEISGMKTG